MVSPGSDGAVGHILKKMPWHKLHTAQCGKQGRTTSAEGAGNSPVGLEMLLA